MMPHVLFLYGAAVPALQRQELQRLVLQEQEPAVLPASLQEQGSALQQTAGQEPMALGPRLAEQQVQMLVPQLAGLRQVRHKGNLDASMQIRYADEDSRLPCNLLHIESLLKEHHKGTADDICQPVPCIWS